MSVDFICSVNKSIHDCIPNTPSLAEVKFQDLSQNFDSTSKYLYGRVFTKWPLLRTKLRSQIKLILQQDGCPEKLPVFLIGKCAEESQQIAVGDLIALTGFKTESSTRLQTGELPWQLTAETDDQQLKIWIVHREESSNSSNPTPGPSSEPSTMAKTSKPSSSRSYEYMLLKDVKPGTTSNVYGIVKFHRPPSKTRGTDYSMMMSLVDESSTDKLKVLIFQKSLEDFPDVSVGAIVRLHRLKVSSYRDEPQGQMIKGSSCVVFSGEVGASMTPKTLSATATLTQQDLDRVVYLREWLALEDNDCLSQATDITSVPVDGATTSRGNRGNCQLERCEIGQFFNLVCQVVARCVLTPNESVLLQVWDGTLPTFAVKEVDLVMYDQLGALVTDDGLQARAGDYCVDVQVFDNHTDKAAALMPGDYVRLTNLHAIQYKSRPPDFACPLVVPVELDLHGGGATYGRDIEVLPRDDPEVVRLRERLERDSSHQSDTLMRSDASGAANPTDMTEEVASSNHIDAATPKVTVLTAHHDRPVQDLLHVNNHPAPYKFRVNCRFKDYMPHPIRAEDLIKLCCKKCRYIGSIPNENQTKPGDAAYAGMENGLRTFSCPLCASTPGNKSILEPTMMLQFQLEDSSGWLVAGLWKSNAEKFFHGKTATQVLQDPVTFRDVQSCLARLCAPSVADPSGSKPAQTLSDVCLKSYSTQGGVCYQIFDTCVDWSDSET